MPKQILHFILIAIVFCSCAAAYKSGHTPDDVYYSPAREVVVKREVDEEKRMKRYEDYVARQDDNYLRMRVRDRYRWNAIDDHDYWFDSRYNHYCHCTCSPSYTYNYSAGYGYYNYGSTYYWNNPYYPVIFYKNPKIFSTVPSKSSVTAFQNPNYNNSNQYYNPKTSQVNGSQNSSTRRVFRSSADDNSSSTTTPTRVFGAGSTSSSAGGRSGGYGSSGSSSSGSRAPRN